MRHWIDQYKKESWVLSTRDAKRWRRSKGRS